MWRRIVWASITGLACLALAGCGGGSSPEQCDEACQLWDACTGAENFYPYEVCYPECEAEGDWDDGYIDCLRQFESCFDMEMTCG